MLHLSPKRLIRARREKAAIAGGFENPNLGQTQDNVTPRTFAERNNASAMSDGVAATSIPHSLKTAILAAAVSSAPPTMAPAWPMRRPAGAVEPAMKPATGFVQFSFSQRAASTSAVPPISPIKM